MQPMEDGPEEACIIDTIMEEQIEHKQLQDVLIGELSNCSEELQGTQDLCTVHRPWRKKEEILPLMTEEGTTDPQKLDLKPLLVELKYAYLEENEQCPVIISSVLSASQENCLLDILRGNKQAIGWKISDLKGINPLVYTHHIYLEEEARPVRQPQRRLNPHMQEVVHVEVLKLLQADIIYPISDSTWVSPTQVVPKQFGVSTVCNEKGQKVPTHLTTSWRV